MNIENKLSAKVRGLASNFVWSWVNGTQWTRWTLHSVLKPSCPFGKNIEKFVQRKANRQFFSQRFIFFKLGRSTWCQASHALGTVCITEDMKFWTGALSSSLFSQGWKVSDGKEIPCLVRKKRCYNCLVCSGLIEIVSSRGWVLLQGNAPGRTRSKEHKSLCACFWAWQDCEIQKLPQKHFLSSWIRFQFRSKRPQLQMCPTKNTLLPVHARAELEKWTASHVDEWTLSFEWLLAHIHWGGVLGGTIHKQKCLQGA